MANKKKIAPLHPGEILLEEFLKPLGLSQNRLALDIRVPARRINEIVLGKRRITADTALRFALYFDMSPKFWLGLQMDYDLDVAEDLLGEQLERDVKIRQTPACRPLRESFPPTASSKSLDLCFWGQKAGSKTQKGAF